MTTWQEAVGPIFESARAAQGVPGMVLAVSHDGHELEYFVAGTDASGMPIARDTLFAVASITKLATALAALRLVEMGRMTLDDQLARYLPEAAAAKEEVTLRRLLCHTAGLPLEFVPAVPYEAGLSWPTLAQACISAKLAQSPSMSVNYSNVGYGLVAVMVERVTGRIFADAVTDLVLAPLGIEAYLGKEPPRPPARVTGAEVSGHVGTEIEPYNTPFWRSLALPWGGLFTTAAGAIALLRGFQGVPDGFLSSNLRGEATRDQTGGLGGTMAVFRWPRCPWGLGVELRGDKSPHFAPGSAAAESFGHAGSSGCLVWSDPTKEMTWAMLSPRTFEGWFVRWDEIGSAVLSAAA